MILPLNLFFGLQNGGSLYGGAQTIAPKTLRLRPVTGSPTITKRVVALLDPSLLQTATKMQSRRASSAFGDRIVLGKVALDSPPHRDGATATVGTQR